MNKERILELLAEVTEQDITFIKNLDENTLLADIGLDSIKFIQFIVAVEEEFNIEINDSDLLFTNFENIRLLFETLSKYFQKEALKKVLIVDCDNVLWNGIAGEEAIYINQKNIDFQNFIISLYEKGVLICLCSKNTQNNIEYAFSNLAMPLTFEQIAAKKINFENKAENIKAIADELNLSVDSFVFVDDSDYEIGLINALLPEVDTIKVDFSWDFTGQINSYFIDYKSGDINRTKQYKEQKEREKNKLLFNSVEEYNKSLETEFICEKATEKQAERIAELSMRTNQFNLSGKRYTAKEIESILKDEKHSVFFLSVTDKYGDMGIVGAAVLNENIIESFMLSCRVFGRGFENVLLNKIKEQCNNLKGIYVKTDKNYRYKDFYSENGVALYE